jgi:uncharacterized membrane protein
MESIQKYECKDVRDVVNSLQRLDKSLTYEEIRNTILELNKDNRIQLVDPRLGSNFFNYIINLSQTFFLWLTVVVTLIMTVIYIVPEIGSLSIIRVVTGAIFVLFIPGYVLIHLIFPRRLEPVQHIALSIGLSFALTPFIGLILNYSPFGVGLGSIVFSVGIISTVMAFTAAYKRFLSHKS